MSCISKLNEPGASQYIAQVFDLIKFFYIVLDIYNSQKVKHLGGGVVDDKIKSFFNTFNNKARNLKDHKEYMDINTRLKFFKERIILLMEFSFLLYEEYKPTKGYNNYSDFIVDRVQKILNYGSDATLTFYD